MIKWTYKQIRNRPKDIEIHIYVGEDESVEVQLEIWASHIHTAIYKIDK